MDRNHTEIWDTYWSYTWPAIPSGWGKRMPSEERATSMTRTIASSATSKRDRVFGANVQWHEP